MRRVIPIALMLGLAACRGEHVERPAATQPSSSKILRADGAEALTITQSSETVEIRFTENGAPRSIRGTTKDSGKRKYQNEAGAVLFEIKPSDDDDGFKLRTEDGKLRWKIKIKDAKVKVSDNEENNNPFELKARDGDRVKVVAPGDRELGNVRAGRVEDASGKTLYVVDASRGAYGVLLLDSIPEVERYILVAELLAREQ